MFLDLARSIPGNLSPESQLQQLVRGHLEILVRESQAATVLFHELRYLEGEQYVIRHNFCPPDLPITCPMIGFFPCFVATGR
jgi:hypothetical protein